jgi:DNA-binding LacI/PurR family transcriptional regulator
MAVGAIKVARDHGRLVPQNLAVVGFDDMDWAPSLRPPLTVVAQPAIEMGELAAAILLDRICSNNQPYQTRVLDTCLITRASCRDLSASHNP